MIALVQDSYNEQHLRHVVEQMRKLGAPTIMAVWVECYDGWVALEGCHRLRAAAALRLTPIISPVDYDDEESTTLANLLQDYDGDNKDITVADIVDDAARATWLEFAD